MSGDSLKLQMQCERCFTRVKLDVSTADSIIAAKNAGDEWARAHAELSPACKGAKVTSKAVRE